MTLKQKVRDFSLSTSALRAFGLVSLTAGLAGAVIQRSLGVGAVSNSQLWELLQDSTGAMWLATIALVFQGLEACAIPIFVTLLIEGAQHTSSFKNYLLRVLLLAVVCEIPYNLAVGGRLWAPESLNPVFAMASCLVMLYFFLRFPEKKASNTAIKAMAVIGVFLWSNILHITDGACCVLLTAVLWAMRDKVNMRNLLGILTMAACSVFSPFNLVGALGFLPVYFYSGEVKPHTNRLLNYLAYPVLLIVFWLLSLFVV